MSDIDHIAFPALPEPRIDPPDLDWKEVEKDFKKQSRAALQAFKAGIQEAYEYAAKISLNTTLPNYLKSLNLTIDYEEGTVTATTNGWLAVAVDDGVGYFDMKPGLLAGQDWRIIRLHNQKFRTVSLSSPSTSWWHPGISGRKITQYVQSQEEFIKEQTIAPFVSSFLERIKL